MNWGDEDRAVRSSRFISLQSDSSVDSFLIVVECISGFGPSGNAPREPPDGMFSSMLLLSSKLLSFSSPRLGFWSIISRMVSRLSGIPVCCEIDVVAGGGCALKFNPTGVIVGGSRGCDG